MVWDGEMVQYGVKRAQPSGSRVLLRERWTAAVARVILVQQPPAESARDALVQMLGTPSGVGRKGHIQVTGPSMQCQSEGFVLVGEQRRGVRPPFLEILIVQW